jgi:signal transduction histidine kinase
MNPLYQILQSAETRRGHLVMRVGYLSSMVIACLLLAAGLWVYREVPGHSANADPEQWETILPMVAMAYGSLLLLAVAIVEVRLRHVRAGSLVIRNQTLDALVSHLTECQEREREALSMRLHDEVGGLLAALKMETERLARRDGRSEQDWQRVESLQERLLGEIRGVSAVLYPRIIGPGGLKAALGDIVERLRPSDTRVECTLAIDGLETDETTGCCVLRIVQEALINAGRHAESRTIWICLERDGKDVVGRVEDDGRGWTNHREGMGLTLMRERARRLNGSVTCDASPRGGARVSFRVPARDQREEAA